MDFPKIYAHISPDGRLLEARTDPPVSQVTMGGRVHEYVPLDWVMSDQADFTLPEEGRPVVVKVLTMNNGVEVPIRARYAAYLSFDSRYTWGLWGWKYLES
jgi:hypothetical protein